MGKEKMYYEEVGYDFDPPFYRAEDKPVVTNADRIRSMTDEELAEYLFIKTCEDGFPQFTTKNDWLDWLRQRAE